MLSRLAEGKTSSLIACDLFVCELKARLHIKLNGVYRPPKCSVSIFIYKVSGELKTICFSGESNFSQIHWSEGDLCIASVFDEILDILYIVSWTQINRVIFNKHGNILDLVFTNVSKVLSSASQAEDEFPADYAILSKY